MPKFFMCSLKIKNPNRKHRIKVGIHALEKLYVLTNHAQRTPLKCVEFAKKMPNLTALDFCLISGG